MTIDSKRVEELRERARLLVAEANQVWHDVEGHGMPQDRYDALWRVYEALLDDYAVQKATHLSKSVEETQGPGLLTRQAGGSLASPVPERGEGANPSPGPSYTAEGSSAVKGYPDSVKRILAPAPPVTEEERRKMLEALVYFQKGMPETVYDNLLDKIRVLITGAKPVSVTRWHIHEWATGFDEDISNSEKNLEDILHEFGIEIEEVKP